MAVVVGVGAASTIAAGAHATAVGKLAEQRVATAVAKIVAIKHAKQSDAEQDQAAVEAFSCAERDVYFYS